MVVLDFLSHIVELSVLAMQLFLHCFQRFGHSIKSGVDLCFHAVHTMVFFCILDSQSLIHLVFEVRYVLLHSAFQFNKLLIHSEFQTFNGI